MPDRTDDPSHDRRSARRAEGGEDRTQAEWAPGPGERAAREERGPGSPERGGSRDEWAPVPGYALLFDQDKGKNQRRNPIRLRYMTAQQVI
ncbi:hypothetical protein AB0N19_28505, partial [Streptomyces sp. NPDC051132]|uniref:hypothetical protein n=1 Tax=Streptomyces sp. NPDC051132 TaxID=3155667 RepID=UPI0034208415